jgi:hypothetical protein
VNPELTRLVRLYLVLDHDSFQTSKAILERATVLIRIANAYRYVQMCLKNESEMVDVRNTLIGDEIARAEPESLDGIVADYTCTFEGNQKDKICPKDDIENALKKLKVGGLLAFTLYHKRTGAWASKEVIQDWMAHISEKHGVCMAFQTYLKSTSVHSFFYTRIF